ncbi:MAG TPA: LytR C-terminal domain-containing protein [Baekduia sp.]|uniref:LytR C-terminal domain-containing protein n=1 Tax=Baekduia sp. TaxID=2600305 RepID=UPI002C3C0F06|nr:LytR C-terminal domain-containing protein [Baekduia sp.]HMJ37490.1 LytR C-terminal domain-containing protein [Baekduia sp.]
MTDFFDDLERQLVAATAERPRRLRRARARHGAVLATVLLALLAGGAALATALTGAGTGDDPGRPAAPATTAQTVTVDPQTGQIAPGSFTVAILNGTAVPGLARGVANRLQNAKFKIGNVTNAARQDHAATVVHYAPGRIGEASRVAAAINPGDTALRPITAADRAIAGAQASVVVIVGSDQNTSPSHKASRKP